LEAGDGHEGGGGTAGGFGLFAFEEVFQDLHAIVDGFGGLESGFGEAQVDA
jgi:hypothetical protein